MKRLLERVLLGGFLSGLGLFAMASCSSTAAPRDGVNGTGGTSATGHGGTSTGTGTGGTGTTSGGTVGVGGNGLPQGGTGTIGSGGTGTVAGGAGVSTGTAGAAAAMCNTDANLVNSTGCFVGCDPTVSTDNPQGLQGAFYLYGDNSSCTQPLVNPPCSTTGICLAGSTVVDTTYAKWGCGIGLELNATGGTTSMKLPYTGPATCFNYVLTGSSGGNEVRLGFTQSADTTNKVSPYLSLKAFTAGATGTICLKDVSCPTPPPNPPNCTNPTPPTPYDLQIQVVGGNAAGAYNICLTSLTPVSSGTSTLAQLCGAQGSTNATEAVGKYFAQNNVNTGDGMLCMTPNLTGTTASFKVDSASFTNGNSVLAAYPSLVDGWHYGHVSTDTALPKLVSALTSVNSSVAYTGSNGKYDASYDIWVLPSMTAATPANGLEVMMWLNDSGVQPAGNNTNSPYMGWEVWTGTVSSWKYVAYRKTGQSSFTGDLAPFIKNAVSVSGLGGTPYLAGIEFGFELYDASGANGFAVTSFTSDVQ